MCPPVIRESTSANPVPTDSLSVYDENWFAFNHGLLDKTPRVGKER